MKIALDDFNYRGYHFERIECELPEFEDLEEVILEDLISMHVIWDLDDYVNFNESFNVKKETN